MKMKIRKKVNSTGELILSFHGELTVYIVQELRDILMKQVCGNNGLRLDLSGIERIDSSGFQLLLSLKQYYRMSGRSLSFENGSSEVKRIFTLYNTEILDNTGAIYE